jgi:pimeloyl-ACP methyl ester carboxylesterase
MQLPSPFFREVGSGPGVVCLHANASTSSQWRALMESLAPRSHVLAADSFGAGKSPAWPMDRQVSLQDEVALLEPVFARAGDPFALVAHSYGAAVALIAAASQPHRIRALALYEPTLFALLDAESPPPNDADGIRDAVAGAIAALDAGDLFGAAERFIDFWMGNGTWAGTPKSRKGPISASVINVRGWARALFQQPTPLAAFSELNVPVLYMMGSDSPASSRGVGRLLMRTLPQVQVVEFNGMGHMGPITHPEAVNEAIARFLEQGLTLRSGGRLVPTPSGPAKLPFYLRQSKGELCLGKKYRPLFPARKLSREPIRLLCNHRQPCCFCWEGN